jgi:hypothetical protein
VTMRLEDSQRLVNSGLDLLEAVIAVFAVEFGTGLFIRTLLSHLPTR